ncbi:MAG: SDR family NAD(P)-dependent oxidoreductase, partial [Synergistes sp.]|nr:SDR family NAD(P)-dependent oxidoreductase [Synergistes sp.]
MARYEELKGKRVLITGAASGIGLATAQVFADQGAKVFVVDYNKEAADTVMKENPAFAGCFVGDVSKEEDVQKAFAKMDETLGGIDVLISNAGISVRADFVDITYEQWKKVIDINLNGMFL